MRDHELQNGISTLIREYLSAVQRCAEMLTSQSGTQDAKQWQRTLGRRGVLSDGKIRFLFHGFGCRVHLIDHSVDWDFGTDGETDWFDACRLHQFAQQFPDKYALIASATQLEHELEAMATQGLLVRRERRMYVVAPAKS